MDGGDPSVKLVILRAKDDDGICLLIEASKGDIGLAGKLSRKPTVQSFGACGRLVPPAVKRDSC